MSTNTTETTTDAGQLAPPDSDPWQGPPAPDESHLADAVSMASDFGAIWVAVAALQVLTGRASPKAAATRLGAAGVVSLVLTRLLKHRYAVPRSNEHATATLARTPSSTSFPSGHTLTAFVAALTIPRRTSGRLAALSFASLVAWARVRVGHHRPADVVAGAAVGIVAGGVLAALLALTGPTDK